MTSSLSVYIDLWRVIAAVAILISHAAILHFGETGIRPIIHRFDYASDAVIVFFVLSGVVIANSAKKPGVIPGDPTLLTATRA
ncbi:MAG: hypothetical protein AAF367_03730 [Pseudomonadota bacterium]